MSWRRTVACAAVIVTALLSGPAPCEAQSRGKIPRIGLMSVGSNPSASVPWQWMGFFEGLRALGYTEGQNILIERRFAGGNAERLATFVTELVQLKVDVIVVTGTREVQAARQATTIPIVTVVAPDLVAAGFVTSLARPGGNITGLTFTTSGVAGKYVELLKEAVPSAARVAVLASRPQAAGVQGDIENAARTLKVALVPLPLVSGPTDFEPIFVRAKREGVNGLIVPSDGVSNLHRQHVVELAAKHRLPSIYSLREFVEAGGLMAYGPSFPDLFRRAATFVDKILKGARPADLPMEQPTKFELVLNLKAVRALGLTFSPALVARADEVLP